MDKQLCHTYTNSNSNSGYHGRGGYLTVETPQYESILRKTFLQAGSYFGYDTIDVNGPTLTGM